MKQIAIIGAGIVGATVAYYLSQAPSAYKYQITVYDAGVGQATKAAAGIISPWISKRRNHLWYRLARDGAALLPKLARAINANDEMYQRHGTIVTRNDSQKLLQLYQLALKRRIDAPEMGKVELLDSKQVQNKLPILKHAQPGVYLSGGGQMNGAAFTNQLLQAAKLNHVTLKKQFVCLNADGDIILPNGNKHFDQVILSTGAWTKSILKPLGIDADIRPQKGQLIEIKTEKHFPNNMPVMMPEGERDFLPVDEQHFIFGATHENEMGFDLSPSSIVKVDLLNSARRLLGPIKEQQITRIKVGTRAYTSDFGPFLGRVPGNNSILVGSGLGSSGLTTGPMMGKLLANLVLAPHSVDLRTYTKPIDQYLKMM